MKNYCATLKRGTKTVMVTLLVTLALLLTFFQNVHASDEGAFSLVDYVSTHEIHSQTEFNDILVQYCNQSIEPVLNENELNFQIDIDYDNRLVYTTVIEELSQTRGTKSGKATSNYYSDSGTLVFTITIEGTFTYSSSEARTLSASGSYSKPFLSAWNSTPTISSGNIYPTLAYARISGTATSIFGSQNYSLTLKCDNNGNLSAS